MKIPYSLTVISLFPLLVNAYTWQFTSQPYQCQNVSLSIQGSGGQPPYSLLIIPTGPPPASPLPNNIDFRPILNIPFSGTSTTLSFNLNYPENSSFVAVVSDKSGFGTGGASTSITVLPSSDSSCYNSSQIPYFAWVFSIYPGDGLTQCESTLLSWFQGSSPNGTVNFYGTIPGGNSFTIPQGSLSTNNDTGTGFNWTVDIVSGTNVLLIGGDNEGVGSGGSVQYTIGYGGNSSCLNNNSPSSTPGNPAGSYSTSTSRLPASTSSTSEPSSNGSGSHSSSNMGAIIGVYFDLIYNKRPISYFLSGGAVGAAIFLALVAFWYFRRRPYSALSQHRPVNVLEDDENGNGEYYDLPQRYALESYPVRDPTIRGTSEVGSTHNRPLLMSTVTADVQRLQTPMTTATTTSFPQLRPANIIQHDDAGPSEDLLDQAGPETIELPPAYSNIRQHLERQPSPLASSTRSAAKNES
ncbi:hypothetical protein F5888DRAFT_822035 [Russula emetica]|nr:hypothetical protein F5888DRAFT_822035 [Russula emetica]